MCADAGAGAAAAGGCVCQLAAHRACRLHVPPELWVRGRVRGCGWCATVCVAYTNTLLPFDARHRGAGAAARSRAGCVAVPLGASVGHAQFVALISRAARCYVCVAAALTVLCMPLRACVFVVLLLRWCCSVEQWFTCTIRLGDGLRPQFSINGPTGLFVASTSSGACGWHGVAANCLC